MQHTQNQYSEIVSILRQSKITAVEEVQLFQLARHISKSARHLLMQYLVARLDKNVNGGERRELIEALTKLQC